MNKPLSTVLVLVLGMAAVPLLASGQSGIYAAVERVVFEPGTGPAERVQVWGAFAVMERTTQGFTTYVFRKPARGYMYFQLPAAKDVDNARREWKDLATMAGTKQAVAFGYWDQYRGDAMPTVRSAESKPESPDVYFTDIGLTKLIRGNPGGTVDELIKLIERR